MKFALVCVLIAFVVGISHAEEHREKNLIDILGHTQPLKNDAAGFIPGHSGHIHANGNYKACRSTAAPATTTAAAGK